ncbi:MAG: Tol-Pal system beta propeller repeat protein TolB, partial [Caldimonas sp.]
MPLHRRVFCAASAAFLVAPARAQFKVEISGVGATQLPIAIARFRDEDRSGQSPSAIIRADLERSGAFRGIDNSAALDETSQPQWGEWRARSADALVAGSAARLADGRYDLRFKLWDVVKGSDLGGQSSAVEAAELRLGSHRIADFVYQKLTGEKGVFSTRIAYVTRSGSRHTLRVADADGVNDQVALNSGQPIISPSWSPNGKELAYVSFERQKAVVFVHNVATGERRAIADFRGSNSAPAWAPDGQSLAVTLSREGGSQLFFIGRNGENPRRITSSQAIDTEAQFSADGRWLYFTSDRGGGPQI